MLSSEVKDFLRLVFKNIIHSVKPRELIRSQIKILDNALVIEGNKFSLNQKCYITGFGKAVYEMGCEIDEILHEHIRKGIFIIPQGSLSDENNYLANKVNYKVFQGAKNNIPDENSYQATQEVMRLIQSLNKDDLLLVLISGGGSALLTCPVLPVTLTEKINVTKLLARSGADIKELNTVRKQLSAVKGGRLAQLVYPCQLISLILSDVINDPLDMIASGPTVKNEDSPGSGLRILRKYSLLDKVSNAVIKVLSEYENNMDPHTFDRSQTFIIGNNSKALLFGHKFFQDSNRKCCILTTCIEGSVENTSEKLSQFVTYIAQYLNNDIPFKQLKESVSEMLTTLCINEKAFESLNSILSSGTEELFLLLGGETTVTVKGEGKGGRNMELALRFSQKINESFLKKDLVNKVEVGLLSGGTDGIDGPTDSAGAIAYPEQMPMAKDQGLDTEAFLSENDSYNFFKQLNNGEDLIVTGHTGTNVMDVIIIYIKKVM